MALASCGAPVAVELDYHMLIIAAHLLFFAVKKSVAIGVTKCLVPNSDPKTTRCPHVEDIFWINLQTSGSRHGWTPSIPRNLQLWIKPDSSNPPTEEIKPIETSWSSASILDAIDTR